MYIYTHILSISGLTQDFTDSVAVLRDLIEPTLHVDKRLGVGHVVNNDDAVGVPVVAAHTRTQTGNTLTELPQQKHRGHGSGPNRTGRSTTRSYVDVMVLNRS